MKVNIEADKRKQDKIEKYKIDKHKIDKWELGKWRNINKKSIFNNEENKFKMLINIENQ